MSLIFGLCSHSSCPSRRTEHLTGTLSAYNGRNRSPRAPCSDQKCPLRCGAFKEIPLDPQRANSQKHKPKYTLYHPSVFAKKLTTLTHGSYSLCCKIRTNFLQDFAHGYLPFLVSKDVWLTSVSTTLVKIAWLQPYFNRWLPSFWDTFLQDITIYKINPSEYFATNDSYPHSLPRFSTKCLKYAIPELMRPCPFLFQSFYPAWIFQLTLKHSLWSMYPSFDIPTHFCSLYFFTKLIDTLQYPRKTERLLNSQKLNRLIIYFLT